MYKLEKMLKVLTTMKESDQVFDSDHWLRIQTTMTQGQ